MEIRKQLSYWDNYQTTAGRLELLSNAFAGEELLRIRSHIAHEGSAIIVADRTVQELHNQGRVLPYVRAFREMLDELRPQDLAIRDKLDMILQRYS